MIEKALEYLASRLFSAPTTVPHPSGDKTSVVITPPGWTVNLVGDDVAIRRQHTITDLASYLRWLAKLPTEQPVEVLLNADDNTIQTRVGTDRYGDLLTCKLVRTSDFALLQDQILDTALAHREFFLKLQALRGALEHAETLLGMVKALKVDANTGVEATIDRRGIYTVANVNNRTDVMVELPSEMAVTLPIFRGVVMPETRKLVTYTLPLTLTIDATVPTRPTFRLECLTLDEVMTDARNDVLDQVTATLEAAKVDHLVGFGSLNVTETRRAAR